MAGVGMIVLWYLIFLVTETLIQRNTPKKGMRLLPSPWEATELQLSKSPAHTKEPQPSEDHDLQSQHQLSSPQSLSNNIHDHRCALIKWKHSIPHHVQLWRGIFALPPSRVHQGAEGQLWYVQVSFCPEICTAVLTRFFLFSKSLAASQGPRAPFLLGHIG